MAKELKIPDYAIVKPVETITTSDGGEAVLYEVSGSSPEAAFQTKTIMEGMGGIDITQQVRNGKSFHGITNWKNSSWEPSGSAWENRPSQKNPEEN